MSSSRSRALVELFRDAGGQAGPVPAAAAAPANSAVGVGGGKGGRHGYAAGDAQDRRSGQQRYENLCFS